MNEENIYPNYWENGTFRDLKCPYYGPDNGTHWIDVWTKPSYGYQMEVLSSVCVNGSFAHLSREEWDKRCYPTIHENVALNRLSGTLSLISFLAGSISNLMTIIAVLYAKYKNRHDFHRTFWKTDIWVLHLAFCELLYCIFFHPHYMGPAFGLRYSQGIGSGFCTVMFVMTILSYTNDWLLVSIVAMTRVIALKLPDEWEGFCENRIYVFLSMLATWIFQALMMLPIFLQPSIGIGYNCLIGKCNYIPTGYSPIPALTKFVGTPKFIGLPLLPAFLTPLIITLVSYVILWLHIKRVNADLQAFKADDANKPNRLKLNKREVQFIWTCFIICGLYFACALPGVLLIDILNIQTPITFLVALTFVWIQFAMNMLIYAYRSEKYRAAYWDVLILILPCMKAYHDRRKAGKLQAKFKKTNLSGTASQTTGTLLRVPSNDSSNLRSGETFY